MSQEIIYTSAQKGLRSGSFGFCTVCSTGGMEPNMADFLEGISAYPHPYKPPDPRTNQNPVNFSHIIWTIGGQRFHILSRVCDAGLDYTGRTNLLAHHVALTRREAESASGGPAWALSDDDFTVSKWDGQLRTLPGRFPRKDDIPLEVCRHWQQASGDAGHAGVLAESCLDKSGRPVTVIYKPETDVLALVREALSLLPVEKRWGVTFSTFYTKIYSSFECQWRFIFAGSPDAAAARKNPHSFVIDLAGPTPPKRASGGALVEAARTGQFAIRTAAAPLAASSGVYVPGRTRPPNLPAIPPPNPLGEHDPRLLPPEMIPAAEEAPRTAIRSPFRGNSQKPSAMTLAVTCLASLCASLLVILGIMLLRKPPENKIQAQIPNKGILPPIPSTQPTYHNPKKFSPESIPVTSEVPSGPSTSEPVPKSMQVAEVVRPDDKSAPNGELSIDNTPTPLPALPAVFFDIDAHERRLLLRPYTNKSGGVHSTLQPLSQIFVAASDKVQLDLIGLDLAFGSSISKLIVIEPSKVSSGHRWTIIRNPIDNLGKKASLGWFELQGTAFSFQWNKPVQAAMRPDALRYCLLRIQVGDDSRTCRLSDPMKVPPIKLDKLPTVKYELPGIDETQLPPISSLLIEVKPEGIPGILEQVPEEAIGVGKQKDILVFETSKSEGVLVQLNFQFSFDREPSGNRNIIIKARDTYIKPGLSVKESLEIAHGALSVSEVKKRKSDAEVNFTTFDRDRRKYAKNLEDQEGKIKAEIQLLEGRITILESKGEAEKDNVKARRDDKERKEKTLARLRNDVNSAEAKCFEATKRKQYAEETLKVANEIIAKGVIQFRIFILIDNEPIELLRSDGFAKEF